MTYQRRTAKESTHPASPLVEIRFSQVGRNSSIVIPKMIGVSHIFELTEKSGLAGLLSGNACPDFSFCIETLCFAKIYWIFRF